MSHIAYSCSKTLAASNQSNYTNRLGAGYEGLKLADTMHGLHLI